MPRKVAARGATAASAPATEPAPSLAAPLALGVDALPQQPPPLALAAAQPATAEALQVTVDQLTAKVAEVKELRTTAAEESLRALQAATDAKQAGAWRGQVRAAPFRGAL